MGKNTTTRHKADNTFRFQSFAERLREINKNFSFNLRDGRRLQVNEDDEDETSNFYQAILQRTELDLTESFTKLLNDIGPNVKTLPQVVHEKVRLLKLLLEHIVQEEARPSFGSSLELVKGLSRDLDVQFRSYMPKFISAICDVILNSKNTEEIEVGFQCIAQLFLNFRLYIIKTFSTYLKLLLPMWSSRNKAYVAVFTAECFQVISIKVWRKSSDTFFNDLFITVLKPNPDAKYGVASLLSAMVKKSISDQETKQLLSDCLNWSVESLEDRVLWRLTTCLLFTELQSHFEEKLDLFNVFCDCVEERLTSESYDENTFLQYLELYHFMLSQNQESRIQSVINRCPVILAMVNGSIVQKSSSQFLFAKIVCSLIEMSSEQPSSKLLDLTLGLIENISDPPLADIYTAIMHKNWPISLYLIPVIKRYKTQHKLEPSECDLSDVNIFTKFASDAVSYMIYKSSLTPSTQCFTEHSKPAYYKKNAINNINNSVTFSHSNLEFFNTCPVMTFILKTSQNLESFTLLYEYTTRFLIAFGTVKFSNPNCDHCMTCCINLSNIIIHYLNEGTNTGEAKMLHEILYHLLEVIQKYEIGSNSLKVFDYIKSLGENIKYHPLPLLNGNFSLWALKGLDNFLMKASTSSTCSLNTEMFDTQFRNSLISNLHCGYKMVRGLCLSILDQTEKFSVDNERKAALELCLKIEELSINEVAFISTANEYLEKLKVLACRKSTVPVISNFILGFMFTNFQPVWSTCVEILKVCLETDNQIAWEGFSVAFEFVNSNESATVPNELEDSDERDFIGRITCAKFALSKFGKFEFGQNYGRLDTDRYRANVWSALEGTNEKYHSHKLLSTAEEIISVVHQKFPFCGLDYTSKNKGLKMALIPVLNFLAKSSTVTNVSNRDSWFHKLKDLLVSPLDVRVLVLKILCRLKPKETSPYIEDLNSIIRDTNLLDLRKFNMDSEGNEIKSEHRQIILDIVNRIVLENSQSKESGKREAVLRSLGVCGQSLVMVYIELALKIWDDENQFRDTTNHLKVVEGRIGHINSMMSIWRYQYIEIPHRLIRIVCRMVRFVNTLDSGNVFLPKKSTLSLARECLLKYFKYFPKLELNTDTVDDIFDVFISPGLIELRKSRITNVTWILRLFKIWSCAIRYRILFTKVDKHLQVTVSSILYELLSSETTEEVKLHLLTVIFNLISEESIDLVEEEASTHEVEIIPAENQFEIGRDIIRAGKSHIINALQNNNLFKQLCIAGKESHLYFNILPRLTEFLEDTDLLKSLIEIVIGSLKFYRSDNDKLLNCFETLRKSLTGLDELNQRPILLKLAPIFTWVKDDDLRKGLYRILFTWKNEKYQPLIKGINSWVDDVMDTPDFKTRYESFQLCTNQVSSSEEIDILFCTLLAHSCFISLEMNTQLGEIRKCVSLLEALAQRLTLESNSENAVIRKQAHTFITNVILSKLRNGVRVDKGFQNVLNVMVIFINEFYGHHGTFAEMKFLVDFGILEALTDLQIQRRTHGMNRLARVLDDMKTEKSVSPLTLMSFVMPLAYHNLLIESQESSGINMNELVDSSIEVVKAILCLVPYQTYLKFVSSTLQKKTTSSKIMKQLERILIGAMESFHFDMSAVSLEEGTTTEVQMEQEILPEKVVESSEKPYMVILSKAAATKCLNELVRKIIPQLTVCLKGAPIVGHKLSHVRKTMVEEGVVSRVSFGKALAKLITKLPAGYTIDTWNSVIPTLCSSIKSKQESVRNVARSSLVEVLREMGMSHFPKAFNYLLASLQRGYEKHVLNFTVSYILTKCEEDIKKFPDCLPIKGIAELCSHEMFGGMREEKSVTAITVKTFEAKKDNAKPLISMCAKFAQDTETLTEIIYMPLEKVHHTSENTKAARSWLSIMSTGLVKNEYIPQEQILVWLGSKLEVYSDNTNLPSKDVVELGKHYYRKPPSSLEIKGLPKRRVLDNKAHKNILLTEFVFQCLYDILKNTPITEDLSKAFIPYLVDGLNQKSKKVNLLALRCITSLFGYGVFEFHRDEEVLNSIWRHTFFAVSTYSLSDTEDSETVNAIFKCLAIFLGTFLNFKILQNDFELMIQSVRSFLTHGHCSSNAMSLLKGIIRKKLVSEEFNNLMEYVRVLSITSHHEHILQGCRGLYTDFILQYCTSVAQCKEKITFYLHHLRYEVDSGRLSAVEMLTSLLTKLPEKITQELAMPYFTVFLVALDHETNTEICKKICTCMKNMFKNKHSVETVSKALIKIMKDKKLMSKHVFAQVGGWLVCQGWHHLPLPYLKSIMKFYEDILANVDDSTDKAIVHTLFSIDDILKFKVSLENGATWNPEGLLETMTQKILEFVRISCLNHDHAWAQCIGMSICNNVLSYVDSSELLKDLIRDESTVDYSGGYCFLLRNFKDLDELIQSHIGVFKTNLDHEDKQIQQATVNLKTFMRLAVFFFNDDRGKSVLTAFVSSVVRLINHEVTRSPGETKQRRVAYDLFDVLVNEGDSDILENFKKRIIRSSLRDYSDSNTPSELKTSAEILMEHIRKKIGEKSFQDTYVDQQQNLQDRRIKNRAKKLEGTVLHPGLKRKRAKSISKSKNIKSKKPRRSQ